MVEYQQLHPRCVSPECPIDDVWKPVTSSYPWAVDCQGGRRAVSPNSYENDEWEPARGNEDDDYSYGDEEGPFPILVNDGLAEMEPSNARLGLEESEPDHQCREGQFDKAFVLVLLKYLELKDHLVLRQVVLDTIKWYGRQKESRDQGWLSDSMESRLRELVGEICWVETSNLRHLLQKQKESGPKMGLRPDHFDRCLTPAPYRAMPGVSHRVG